MKPLKQIIIRTALLIVLAASPLMADPSSVKIGGVEMILPQGWTLLENDVKDVESRTVVNADRTHAISIATVEGSGVDSLTSVLFQAGVVAGITDKGGTVLDRGMTELAERPAFHIRFTMKGSPAFQDMLVVVAGPKSYVFVVAGMEAHPAEAQDVKMVLSNVKISGPKDTAAYQAGHRFGKFIVGAVAVMVPIAFLAAIVTGILMLWRRRKKSASA